MKLSTVGKHLREKSILADKICEYACHLKKKNGGRSQDGGGIGRGDHFLSYKFIERTIER